MTLTLDIPASLEEYLRRETPDLDAEARIAVALDWYRKEKISTGKLAEILGISRWEIDGWLNARGEYAQTPTMEDLARDFEGLQRLHAAERR